MEADPTLQRPSALRAARWATRAQFAVLGGVTGAWGVHIPTAKAHYGLDAAALSIALLAAAAGAVACLTQAGRVVARFGARRVAQVAGVLVCAALALVVASHSFALLLALMLVFGAASALFDVAINAEGSVLEGISGKKVMSGFHGMFSAGGMVGAGVGALLIRAQVPASLQLVGAGLTLATLAVVAGAFMLPVHPAAPEQRAGYRLPQGALAVFGLLGAVGLIAEGTMYDWSVLYLQSEVGAPPALAALGYASFSAAMAATRFCGDWLRSRIAAPRLMAASALLAAAAMAAVLLLRDPVATLVGFALVGVGFANVVPILFMAATRVEGVAPATAIASVSSIGYLGFLFGPPLVGGITHALSLSWGLCVVVAGALLLAWGARRVPA